MNKYVVVGAVVVVGALVGAAFAFKEPITNFLAGGNSEPVATTTPDTTNTWSRYATSTFSIEYPAGYTVNAAYAYTEFGPTKPIAGVSFTIPAAMATGTNLSADTYLSVEQLPRAKNCTGDIYVKEDVWAERKTIGGMEYSVATSSGAAAGNLYEDMIFAIPGSNPCTAVRYRIHSTNPANYEPGAIREFDRAALLKEFDEIRKTLQLGSTPATPTATTTQP
jgi:hypothetical protein